MAGYTSFDFYFKIVSLTNFILWWIFLLVDLYVQLFLISNTEDLSEWFIQIFLKEMWQFISYTASKLMRINNESGGELWQFWKHLS